MDPAIAMLIVSQLLIATAIAYATAVEVTVDGLGGFVFCLVFSVGVIWCDLLKRLYTRSESHVSRPFRYAKRSGWTLYSGRWNTDVLGVNKYLPPGIEQKAVNWVRLVLTVAMPVQLLLFPATWAAGQWGLLDPWLIDALHKEQAWAVWGVAMIMVMSTYIPLYRTHGPAVFFLSVLVLAAIVVVVFFAVWSFDHPLAGAIGVILLCITCAISNVDLSAFRGGKLSPGETPCDATTDAEHFAGGRELSIPRRRALKVNAHDSPRPVRTRGVVLCVTYGQESHLVTIELSPLSWFQDGRDTLRWTVCMICDCTAGCTGDVGRVGRRHSGQQLQQRLSRHPVPQWQWRWRWGAAAG